MRILHTLFLSVIATAHGFVASVVIHFTALAALFTMKWLGHQVGHVLGIILFKLLEG